MPIYRVSGVGTDRERARFKRAVLLAKKRLDGVIATVSSRIGPAEAAIFSAQRMILDDPELHGQVARYIEERRWNAESALITTLDSIERRLTEVADEYLSERASDMGEVKRRLLDVLANVDPALQCTDKSYCQRGRDRIIVADLLTPSLTVDLNTEGVRGFVTERGGPTSHAAILARSLGVPAVSGIPNVRNLVSCGTNLLIDGDRGEIVVWPGEHTLSRAPLSDARNRVMDVRPVPGFRVMANIGLAEEVSDAKRARAEGVGLYRTELELFRAKRMLSEEDQLAKYRFVLDAFGEMPIYFRLFDLGGDKTPPFLDRPREQRPCLGVRGSRLLLARTELWRSQARALARASVGAHQPVHVLYPMTTGPEQFVEIREAFSDMTRDVSGAKILHGAMIEVPAACLRAHDLLRTADFASLGTNDLMQYLFAFDRDDELVAREDLLDSPVLWSLLEQVARAARDLGRPLSVCGEVAADTRHTEKILAAGLTRVSVGPRRISPVRAEARRWIRGHGGQHRQSAPAGHRTRPEPSV